MKKIFVLIGCFFLVVGCDNQTPNNYLLSSCVEFEQGYNVDKCKCWALKYEKSLTRTEREALLNSTGTLLMGKGWKVNTPERETMIQNIFKKMQDANVACGLIK